MKYLAWLVGAGNIWFGLNNLLNAVGILKTGKYGQGATWVAAVLFLGLGAASFYWSVARGDPKTGLLLAVAPWAVGLVLLLIAMLTSSYQ